MPGHERSRVVLGGQYGKPGRRRQLYVCNMPRPGSAAPTHRFSAPLTVPLPAAGSAGAGEPAEPDELRTARKYQFTAHDIATGLVAVARGTSYTQAGQDVRRRAAERWGSTADDVPRRHGTLVSDWVEVYAQALWHAQAPYQQSWPDSVFLGVLPITGPPTPRSPTARPPRSGGRSAANRLVFAVFVAMAYRADGTPAVLAVDVAQGTGTAHWAAFLRRLASERTGSPLRVVGDGSPALQRAVRTVWPTDPPMLWIDEYTLRRQARRICRDAGLDGRSDPLWTALQRAWRSRADWERFADQARRYRLPALDRWLADAAPVTHRQMSLRSPGERYSSQMVRAALATLESRLTGRRSAFGNRVRTQRLLLLMALDASGSARVHGWADLICVWLEQTGGRPTSVQRRIADRGGRPSLGASAASSSVAAAAAPI